MKRLFLLTAALVCTLFPLSVKAACPTSDPNPLAYVRRDNNRCEGLRDGRDASGSLFLISFVTSSLKDISNPLKIRVPGSSNPILEVQEFSRNYRLDEVKTQSSGNGSTFSLNSRILQNAGITKTENLFAIAYTMRDASPMFYIPLCCTPKSRPHLRKFKFVEQVVPNPCSINPFVNPAQG
jgi:hypothetical protein